MVQNEVVKQNEGGITIPFHRALEIQKTTDKPTSITKISNIRGRQNTYIKKTKQISKLNLMQVTDEVSITKVLEKFE